MPDDGKVPALRPPCGAGPGVITADGCAMEFYSLLPPASETTAPVRVLKP